MRIFLDDLITKVLKFVFGSKNEDWDDFWKEKVNGRRFIELEDPFQQKVYAKTHKKLMTFLGSIVGKNILEIGAGSGYDSILFATEGANKVTLLDESIYALQYSKLLAQKLKVLEKIEFIHGNCKALPVEDESYDIVFSTGLLEHFGDDVIIQILLECKRVMKKNAKIAMTVPNLISPEIVYRILRDGGIGTERHLSKRRLLRLFKEVEFKNVKVQSASASVIPSCIKVKVNLLSQLIDMLIPLDYLRMVIGEM